MMQTSVVTIISSSVFANISPVLEYSIQDKYLQHLRSPFIALNEQELDRSWSMEYQLGVAFAEQLDLYQALICFKRAEILIPSQEISRRREIQYRMLCCYYFGKKYKDVICFFEDSLLSNFDENFTATHDLLLLVCEAYIKEKEYKKAEWILQSFDNLYPEESPKLRLSSAVMQGDLTSMQVLCKEIWEPDTPLIAEDTPRCQRAVQEIYQNYHTHKKSPTLAAALNAVLPGAGYLYLGQTQTAFTSLCLNSLMIASTTYFVLQNNIAAAILAAGFECGWYFGGIMGAKDQAHFYNSRLFEKESHYRLRDYKMFPVLMLHYGF